MYITYAPTSIIDMALSHRGIGYSKGLVTLLRTRYNIHMRQTKSSIFSICSWWGFSANKMWIPHGPLHSSIQLFFGSDLIHSDPLCMWSVPWHFTTQRWGCSIVDHEFVPEDCTAHSLFAETVPVLFYFTDESLSWLSRRCITNFETFSQFVPILCMIIFNNLIPRVCLPIDFWFKYRYTIISIIKEPIANIIWIVQRVILVIYLKYS